MCDLTKCLAEKTIELEDQDDILRLARLVASIATIVNRLRDDINDLQDQFDNR